MLDVERVGNEGTLWNTKLWLTQLEGLRADDWVEMPSAQVESGSVLDHPYPSQVDHFVECVVAGKPDSVVDLGVAFRSHRVIFAIEKPLAEGRPVKVAELA